MPQQSIQRRLADLRHSLKASLRHPGNRPSLTWPLFSPGLPLGVLTQVLGAPGSGKTESVVALAASHSDISVAWVEERLTVYPPEMARRGVDLDRLLFVEAKQDYAWAVAELVASQTFGLVVAASPLSGEIALRRLQLAAERTQTAVLLLAAQADWSWPIGLHLTVRRIGRSRSLKLEPLLRWNRNLVKEN